MSRDYFYSLLYCDRWKFNLTGGFLIFLFMVTGREIIFICSTFFICWTRLKIAKPLATASELIRKNSVSYLKNQAIFSQSERTGLNSLLRKSGEVHTSAKWLFNYSWMCFLKLKAVDKEFSLYKKTGLYYINMRNKWKYISPCNFEINFLCSLYLHTVFLWCTEK